MADLDQDALTIAQAIDKGWCWKNCARCDGTGEIEVEPGLWEPCFICPVTGRVPDIGKHNALDVIEWAAKQGWWEDNILPEHNNLPRKFFPKTFFTQRAWGPFLENPDVKQFVLDTISTIASAIRASK